MVSDAKTSSACEPFELRRVTIFQWIPKIVVDLGFAAVLVRCDYRLHVMIFG